MGVKKRRDVTPVTIELSQKSYELLKELPHDAPLKQFVKSTDLPSQLSALKLVTGNLRQGDKEGQSVRIIELLLDCFCNIPVKSQLTKALSSVLASMAVSWHSLIYRKLQEYLMQTCAVDITNVNFLRDVLMRISLLYDSFVFDESNQDCNWLVICFLSDGLQHNLCKLRLCDSPTDRNIMMADVLLSIQLLNKIIQKSISNNLESLSHDAGYPNLTKAIQNSTDNVYAVLLDESFVTDCHTAAGMFVPLLFKWFAHDHLLAKTRKYLMDCDSDDTLIQSDLLAICLEGKNFSQLPVQSEICLLHGILAVFDVVQLTDGLVDGKCFLVDCLADQLLQLTPRVSEKNAKLVYSRTLVLLANKIRSAAECTSDEVKLRLHPKLHGMAYLPANLVKYARLHWDDPLDVIRHQARIVFEQVIACHLVTSNEVNPHESPFFLGLIKSLMEMDWSVKSKYGLLSCLVNAVGASTFLSLCKDLPQVVLAAACDQTMACHVGEFLEKLYLSHYSELCIKLNDGSGDTEEGKKFILWCETWVNPILKFLVQGKDCQKSSVTEYIVPNLLQHFPQSLAFICDTLTRVNSLDDQHLGALITCLKYVKSGRNHGLTPSGDEQFSDDWSKTLMKQALCHTNPQIRLDAVGLLCEHSRTTEIVQSRDLDLIQFFLSLNLSNQMPAFRQHLVAILKKLFIRLRDSGQMLNRHICTLNNKKKDASENEGLLLAYRDFFHFLCNLCFDALHSGASFPLRTSALAILSMLIHVIGTDDRKDNNNMLFHFVDVISDERLLLLINCFNDTFEQNKMEAFFILTSLPQKCLMFLEEDHLHDLFSAGLQLAQSTRPQDCTTAAYLLRFLLHVPKIAKVFEHSQLSKTQVIYSESVPTHQMADFNLDQRRFHLASILLILLQEAVQVASSNLMLAAAWKPMYPTLHCIRYILCDISYSQLENLEEWRCLLNLLIDICFQIAAAVSPVVNNSSPEGNIPLELENLPTVSVENSSLSFLEESGSAAETDLVLDLETKVRLMPEYLSVCGWRSIKEISLILGQLMSTVPLIDPKDVSKSEKSCGLISVPQLHLIGAYFTRQLLESRHRGAFELAYAGFVQMTETLWNCTLEGIHELPITWLDDVMTKVKVHDPDDQLCSTRRSAGVPFYIQALVTTEPSSSGRRSFKNTMCKLLDIASQPIIEENTAQVHARNILRALFRDTRLGEDVYPYIADGVQVAILGYKSSFWLVRNSSTLLFSSLVTRIFGVKPTQGERFQRNYLTGRVFFSRFPSLFEFLLNLLKEAAFGTESRRAVELHPGIYPVLMILGRLCPSVAEGSSSTLNLEQFVPYIIECAGSAVYKIRYMAAQAICPMVTKEKTAVVLLDLLNRLPTLESVSQNFMHGICLQVAGVLKTVSALPQSLQLEIASAVIPQLMLKIWILTRQNPCLVTRLTFSEIVFTVVHAKWPVDLEEQLQEQLILLGQSIMNQSKTEILFSPNAPDPSPIPGHLQYLCGLAALALNAFTDSRFFNSSELLALIKCLLGSSSYDLVVEAVQFINHVFGNQESKVQADYSKEMKYLPLQNAAARSRIQDCLTGCEDFGFMLMQMVFSEGQKSFKCLDLTLKALSSFSLHLSSQSNIEDGLMKLWNISKVKQILTLLNSYHSDDIRVSALELIDVVLPELCDFIAKEKDIESEVVLDDICDFIETLSCSYNSSDLRMACCQILVHSSQQLLIDTLHIMGHRLYKMWRVLFRLLHDEDSSVRETASRSTANFVKHPASGITGHSWCSIESNFATALNLEVFINLHNIGWKSWLSGGLSTLLDWLLDNLEPASSDEKEDIRLFDRGEMNTYKDELFFFFKTITASFNTITPYIVSSFEQLRCSDAEMASRKLASLFGQFSLLVSEASTLSVSSANLPSTAFLQNAQYVAEAVEFERKATTAIWLGEILSPLMSIPEETSEKLAAIQALKLSLQKRSRKQDNKILS